MPKNPNKKSGSPKLGSSMRNAVSFLLAGCAAELYLLTVRRFYVSGTAEQVIAWDSYLVILGWIGLAAVALGAALSFMWKTHDNKRVIGWFTAGSGAFLSAISFLAHWNMSTLTLLNVLVPTVILLGILWNLYDREYALSLTIMGFSLIALWACRKQINSLYLGVYVKALIAAYAVFLAAVAFLLKQGKLRKLLPAKADPSPIYVASGISILAILTPLFSATIAYYATWALALVVFGLTVYYTVKQL